MSTFSEPPATERGPAGREVRGHHGARQCGVLAVLALQAFFVLIVAWAPPAHAASFGTVSGTVRTLAGAPVPDALVTLSRTGGGFTTTTGSDGSYSKSGLPFDDYDLEVQQLCFSDVSIPITVDGAETKDVVLGNAHDTFGHVCRTTALSTFAANTTVPLTGDDAVASLPLGFSFPYYGGAKTQAFISTNGFLTFTAPPSGAHASNQPLLSPDTPPDGIFPFWDDLLVDSSAEVRTILSGSAPNRVRSIEWHNVAFQSDHSLRLSFLVSLFEDGRILMNWQTGSTPRQQGSSATVGLRNGVPGQAFDALELSEDEPRVTIPGTKNLEFLANRAPVARAGADKTVGSGASFALDGTASADPDGNDGLAFTWVQVSGPATTIQDPKKAKTQVTGVRGPATLTYQLKVVDPFGRASFDTVTMSVSKPK